MAETEKIDVKTLNTIECIATSKYHADTRLMVCTIMGGPAEPFHRIEDVYDVEGDIAVISSRKPDTIYVKTTPHIGMAAHIEVIPRRGWYPPGKTIKVKVI